MAAPNTPSTPLRRGPVRRTSRGKRIARWVVVFFAVAVIIDAIVGERGLLATLRAREQYDAATAALEQQRTQNAELREKIERLKNDPAAIEELAREDLGLMRPGEKLFIIRDLKSPSSATR